ncbi:hypothetical protein ACFOON_04200 [Novosphingobium piscinae]|uniref:Argininosuccinate lyase n=1 Tax=Novosphingobium piscinae TaxID=1507448 RepID=A0A7X1G1F1_9SPHN|nr:hypothetical protein [Novosphingobium piscinae]MBC2670893.1 hypothetical protein [Novosphingobium piscinae]
MIRLLWRSTIAVAAIAALAGCDKTAPGQSDAAVPVLPGSASDAMLPLDTVTSQPPLDPRAVRSGRAAEPGADATEAAEAGEEGAAAAPVPAAAAAAGPVE